MLPFLKNITHALLFDELAFRRWCRGITLAFAGTGFAFADQLAALINAPMAVTVIKVASVVCAFLGGTISIGQKNKPVEEIAAKVAELNGGSSSNVG